MSRPLKIGIELRQPVAGASGGIVPFLKGVFGELFRRYPDDRFLVFCTHLNGDLLAPLPPNVRVVRLPTQRFFADLDRIALVEQLDVLFRSYPMDDDLAFPPERQVAFIPDLQHELLPELFAPDVLRARRLAFNRALARAGAIGTSSEHARQTLRAHPWTACQDLCVLSHALPPASTTPLSAREQALLPDGEFILYPANLWPHKNHRRLLQAFGQVLERTGRPIELILTGHPAGWPALAAEFPSLPVRHLGFVSPQLLQALYKRARALAFFSLYEGFGMPLLEAFAAGTPVVCSNTTSLPEVAGDAALMCDPTDIAAMADLIVRALDDEPLRGRLIARGRERLAHYSWAQAADALHAACARVATPARQPIASPATNTQPLVSIITPSYNQGRFIERTIESVLGQSYPHIEYIVVDGGSSDETVALLQTYGNRFSWVSEPDRGQTDAINKGFALAHGSIYAYLNSDDVLCPDAVASVVRYLQCHPDVDMAYGRAEYIDAHGTAIGYYPTAPYTFERLMSENCVCQPAAFWRRRIAEQVGPFDERLHYAMDYDYWLRIDRAGGRIAHMHDLLAASRTYPETKTRSARQAMFDEIFQSCDRHAGYVNRNYFYGLWDYMVFERTSGWPRYGRKLPKFVSIMARLHYQWYHRRRYTPRYLRDTAKQLVKRSPWLLALYSASEPGWHAFSQLAARAVQRRARSTIDRTR